MKKIFFIVFFILSISVFAKEVPSNNQGVANASPGDYIFRSNGEKVILSQTDIDYARRQLGLLTTQKTQTNASSNNTTSSVSSTNSSTNTFIVLILIVVGIIIVIGVCVSNITTTVAKNSGMDEESAKKVGNSAGVLAGTAAAIGAALLLGKAGGIDPNPNNITITHKRR